MDGRGFVVLVIILCSGTLVRPQRELPHDPNGVDSASASGRERGNAHFGNCFDERGNPRKCVPEFQNAAYGMAVEATSSCGLRGPVEYCIQTGSLGLKRACEICDRSGRLAHGPSALTDLTTSDNETWWQSETLFEGIQQVNLTLKLRKAFDITYIRLKFHSPRPESFAIYKRVVEDGPWLPYQFYSAACRDFYNLPDQPYVYGGDETRPLCTSEFSDISPLTGGNVAFSTLEGRPSAFKNFENSKELSEWVTATDIRITLDRLNTFGDEVFGDEKVLRSYFYAIADLSVGGVCKCNGHASRCDAVYDETGDWQLACACEHNTAGRDCEQCLPYYHDVPWGRATSTDVHECKSCNCNGFSNRCYFKQDLYETTGHGGHCLDCAGNRDGANCEKCKPNYYQRSDGYCIPCDCDQIGARSQQCNSEGKCQCQPGVAGEKCDRCQANYFEFTTSGCRECGCSIAGSIGNEPSCTLDKGHCSCKENVEGNQCSSCKPNYFNLDVTNEFGCTPCFCNGHSAVCRSAPGYGQVILESVFSKNNERWSAEESLGRQVPVQFSTFTQSVSVSATGRDSVFFVAPERYLGDQRGSYNQELNFTLRIGEHGPKPSADDLILEGAGIRISQPIFGNRNSLPSTAEQEFSFRLHEKVEFGWNPRVSSRDFMSILSNLTAIKIRATYTPRGTGFLDNVKLKTARRGSAGSPAPWIETCDCPDGFVGQYCESCTPGYKHEPKNGGAFARCVPCFCNGHSKMCDPESGQCICREETKTAGDNCEKCARGYFGNPQQRPPTPGEEPRNVMEEFPCKECPCPRIGDSVGACIQLADTTVVCLECPTGYAGPTCQFCGDGFYGDPTGQLGPKTDCKPCLCNGNIDSNAVGNCNRTTGECLKCVYNTGGARCEKCLAGFFGDALKEPKGDCKPCDCFALGTIPTEGNKLVCEQPTGQCQCKNHVTGLQCDKCEDGFYDLASGVGCSECQCDLVGSVNATCNVGNGQCHCRDGVVGLRCNDCAPNHYGFSLDGCKPCECDHIGSLSLQCDPNGLCPCRENVEGRACDRCKENKYNRQAGCVDCPPCYNLIQDAVTSQRRKLNEMTTMLDKIKNTLTVSDDQDFEEKLAQVQARVEQLWTTARSAAGAGAGADEKGFLEKINDLKEKINGLDTTKKQINDALEQCSVNAGESSRNLTLTEEAIERASEALKNAQRFLDSDGKEALARAQAKANEFGQQSEQMSEFAKQARLLADEHEKTSLEIEKVGNLALNTSKSAHDLLWNSINQERALTDEARLLHQSTRQLEDEMRSTKVKAQDALDKAKQSHDNALNLYKDANSLGVPVVDLVAIKEQAGVAKGGAQKLKDSVEKLMEEKADLLREYQEDVGQTRTMLDSAIRHQQAADELMADLHNANASAEEARKQAENVFEEASKIYETLQDFNQNVEDSKKKAKEAMEKMPEIRQAIYDADVQTRNNKGALFGAKTAASTARADADEAKRIAEKASKEAGTVRTECSETKNVAENLRDEVDTLGNQVSGISTELSEAEILLSDDDIQVKTALEKASEAQTNAKQAYTQVQNALNTVREIQLTLDNLDNINDEGLEGLERKIIHVEAEFNSAGLDEKIESLREARNKQLLWIKNYEDELEFLKREVENVQEIRNSLPPKGKCWKRMRLEPT